MLFVFSAGNEGEFCRDGTGACNLQAAAILKLRETEPTAGTRVLYVGSLSDASSVSEITGLPKALAPYSHTAGDMKNDYIVAHDDIFYYQQGIGTSFAAPRVVGAAALVRQKFPTLNGANLKQVLLQSADDLGAPGVDEIFGHGQLNVINALSPIDGLSE
ncbi:MAG: S8 family serine peptidase [Alphaproteobacteria bacterium]|nr:S8 family serine peptidase [Alphaproteobacteria bacterium]